VNQRSGGGAPSWVNWVSGEHNQGHSLCSGIQGASPPEAFPCEDPEAESFSVVGSIREMENLL